MDSIQQSKNTWRLAWIAMLNDLGSEVLTRLVPLYVSSVLGAPMSAVGAIEGIAESSATLLKPIFGSLSDRFRKRKAFVTIGYAISALARPFLFLAGSWPQVAFLRFCDRLGKGVRAAPRDALIADSTTAKERGRGFGLNRSLDTLGALLGVIGFGAWTLAHREHQLDARTWKWLTLACSIPGIFAVALAAFGIREMMRERGASVEVLKSSPLGSPFIRYASVVGLFALANSSDAFILLRARELGYSLIAILGMIALLNAVSALTAIPAALLSDRFGRRTVIASGWTVYALAYGFMGSSFAARNFAIFAATVAVYGLFSGMTDGVESAWIADLVPRESRGRAFGIFGLVTGCVALPASLGFGFLWDQFGSEVPFLASSAIALFATALLFVLMPKRHYQHA